jgi:hypothetical protein
MPKKIFIFLLLLGAVWLVACSGQNTNELSTSSSVTENPISQTVGSEETRAEVLLLLEASGSREASITEVSLYGKPFSLGGKRFLTVTGIIGDGKKALIEIAGDGRLVGVGERIEGYFVKEINKELIVLERKH